MKETPIKRHVLIVAAVLCLSQLRCIADNEDQGLAVEKDWAAIEHCLGIIRLCQLNDGMIRMTNHKERVWTVPYFSNLAAMALLAANNVQQNQEDVARVENWLMWYATKQESDGTIYDREGTISAYQSSGKRDSTDSYAATYLMTVWRYQQAIGKHPSDEIINAARKALSAIDAVVQNDGLTIAKPEYAIKYLMDNIEVYQGLIEGALFFDAVGMEKQAQKTRKMALRIAGRLKAFWSEQDQHFAFALDMKDKFSRGFSKPYPHGLAQLFALSYFRSAQPDLWSKVNKAFKPGEESVPVERWLIAGIRNAGPDELVNLRRITREEALSFSGSLVNIERPAMVVIALLDDQARFTDVPMFSKKSLK